MLQTYSNQSDAYFEGGGQNVGLGHYLAVLKRRVLYFLLPFLLVFLTGAFVTAIQRPLYEASGKILVESPEIPTDLVKPTVQATANERIQVIQQRILTRENLLAIVNKYGMFVRERQWMSDTQLLDLMRDRTKFELVDINAAGRPGTSTIAFTVSFEYENPEATLQVTNNFLTLILDEDARNRTNRAAETTAFLTRESQRLQGELTQLEAQINESKAAGASDDPSLTSDPAKMQVAELTKLKEDLAQKSSTYSSEYPQIKALKKKIAAMAQLVAQTPTTAASKENVSIFELQRRAAATEKNLEDTNKKLEEARLGEKLERDQQSERLQVIEQPVLPQKPVKPNRFKLMAAVLALALVVGAGVVFVAESLDASIRYSHQLLGVASGRMIVLIPYIATRSETSRRRRGIVFIGGSVALLLLAGVIGIVFFGPPLDLSWVNQYWLDQLTRLSK